MSFRYAIPSNHLKPFIKQYWAFDNELDNGLTHSQRIFATGLPEITFYFGKRPDAEKRNFEGNVLMNVQQNDYYDLVIRGKLSIFSITFQPQGLTHFLKIPLNELQNQTVYLGHIDKPLSYYLEHVLNETKTFEERVCVVENCFIRLLSDHRITIDHKRMDSTVELITSTKGNITINLLTSNACLSRKQFERKFITHIGTTPKQYLKIIRFQNAVYLNQSVDRKHLTKLAHSAGYYDQSHFINETKELTGYTPKKLFESGEIVSDFFKV